MLAEDFGRRQTNQASKEKRERNLEPSNPVALREPGFGRSAYPADFFASAARKSRKAAIRGAPARSGRHKK
jgi:hypothetical protein